ncbi:MAG: tetratricopeptide repeat protein [Candidatus Natronoplasma sp.]
MELNIRDRVLLHLGNYKGDSDSRAVPYDVSQKGIAEIVGGSRSHISRVLRDMKKEGSVREKRKYVEADQNRKRKVYFLTREGIKEENELRERLKKEIIVLKTSEKKEKLKLEELDDYLDIKDPILFAAVNLSEDDILDLSVKNKRSESIFIDRISEMNILKERLKKIREGELPAIFIVGEAGTGKTTLAMEFKKYVLDKGYRFLYGKSYSEREDPYLPLKQAFKKFDGKKDQDSLISILNKGKPKKEIKIDNGNLEARRHSVYFEFTNQVRELAKEEPLVIFLDDLQWGDAATLHLLTYMMDNLSEDPVFFMGAYRSEEITKDHPLMDIRTRLSRNHDYEEIKLNPLEKKHTREILRSIMDPREIPSNFLEFIHEMTEGNPLFVKEFAELIRDERDFPEDLKDYPTEKEDIDLPRVVEDLLKRRIDLDLNERSQKIASLGSIIGEEIPFKLLRHCSIYEEMELLDIIDDLLEVNIWEENTEIDGFKFSHKLLWKVVYDNTSSFKRKKLHRNVADEIESIYEDRINEFHLELGYHYEKADETKKAAKHYFKAGQEAERVYAHENAIEMYKKTLKLSGQGMRLDILERLGEVCKIEGKYSEAIKYFQILIDDLEKTKSKQRIFGKLCETYTKQGEYIKALEVADKGLSLSKEKTISRSSLLHAKGWVHLRKGDYKEARKIFEEERSVAEKIENQKELARALHDIGSVDLQEGRYDKAEELMNRAVNIREKEGLKIELTRSLNNLGNIYYLKGDLEKALQQHERSLEIREKIDDKSGIASSLNNIAVILMKKGEFEKSLDFHQRSLEIKRKIGDKSGIIESLNNMGIIYENKGDLEKALDFYQRSMKMERDIGEKRIIATSLNNIGNIYYQKGELQKSLDYYQKSLEINENIGDKLGSIPPKYGLAEVYLELEEFDKALKYAKEALSLCFEIGAKSKKGISQRVLGKVYRELDEPDKAMEEFEKALEVLDDTDDRADYWKTVYEKSLLLINKGEKKEAKNLLNSALGYFDEHEMNIWFKKCKDRLKEIGKIK